jgi:hypothetical protein
MFLASYVIYAAGITLSCFTIDSLPHGLAVDSLYHTTIVISLAMIFKASKQFLWPAAEKIMGDPRSLDVKLVGSHNAV